MSWDNEQMNDQVQVGYIRLNSIKVKRFKDDDEMVSFWAETMNKWTERTGHDFHVVIDDVTQGSGAAPRALSSRSRRWSSAITARPARDPFRRGRPHGYSISPRQTCVPPPISLSVSPSLSTHFNVLVAILFNTNTASRRAFTSQNNWHSLYVVRLEGKRREETAPAASSANVTRDVHAESWMTQRFAW